MKSSIFLALGATLFLACNNKPAETTEAAKDTATVAQSAPAADYEIGDAKFIALGKRTLDDLASGNIDGMVDGFTDDAKFYWSSGDSLVGKKAILDYWKNRRGNVIDSMQHAQEVWIPIKINKSQSNGDRPGNWLLCWYQNSVKYKNGKKLGFFVHTLLHFDANDKIDEEFLFLDRGPINKALGVK